MVPKRSSSSGSTKTTEVTDVKAASEETVVVDIVTEAVLEVVTEVKKHTEDVTEAVTEVVTDVKGATETHVLVVKGLVAEEEKIPAAVVPKKIQSIKSPLLPTLSTVKPSPNICRSFKLFALSPEILVSEMKTKSGECFLSSLDKATNAWEFPNPRAFQLRLIIGRGGPGTQALLIEHLSVLGMEI
ncbi:hypothetical protein LWI28_011759 [Acer negundo]|uniref:Uncharacterized protein n=1 Tax=Acer negundo TaxID=4023 RepID=A0AAD5I5T4_ACENE|nr:hypothetical protein LWI28_011759 [Acer negundo]